jgi:hypothetical protein
MGKLSESIKEYLQNVDWKKIKLRKKYDGMFDRYSPDFGISMFLDKECEKGTAMYVRPTTRHTHISVHPSLQRLGLATKMLKALAKKINGIVIARGRVINPTLFGAVDKIKSDSEFEVTENEFGEIKILYRR